MLHGRIGTLAVGGLAAYLLINKAMNIVGHSIDKICDAGKWKAYYKYSVNGVYTVAPGYSSFVRPVDEKQEFVVAKDPERKNSEKTERSETGLGASVVEAVLKAIKDKLDGAEAPEEAVEGETEASEPSDEGEVMSKTVNEEDKCVDTDESTDKPHDYAAFMTYIHDCEEKGMDEKEIALSLGMDVSTLQKNIRDAEIALHDTDGDSVDIFENAETNEEPLYTDDLYDGVKVIEEEGEADEDLD